VLPLQMDGCLWHVNRLHRNRSLQDIENTYSFPLAALIWPWRYIGHGLLTFKGLCTAIQSEEVDMLNSVHAIACAIEAKTPIEAAMP